SCRQVFLPDPVIDDDELARLIQIDGEGGVSDFRTVVVPCLFRVADGGEGLRRAVDDVRRKVSDAIAEGATIVVLSDRGSTAELAPIPMLLATAAVHHHLIREKTRTRVGLVVETGEAREVHHLCLLLGYGAAAINPYLAFETIDRLIEEGLYGFTPDTDRKKAHRNYVKAAGAGILKVMSKMGISTVQSYTGAQIFEAIGIARAVVVEYFTCTVSLLDGVS